MKPNITKAEILITRRCNIFCGTCAVIKRKVNELDIEGWKRATSIIYEQLGSGFISIYGGEPLVMGDDFLCELFSHLASYRTPDRDFTVISNSIGMTEHRARRFMEAGLESWSASVDTVEGLALGDKYMDAKTHAGLRALEMFRSLGLRDTMATLTVTARNIDHIYDTVKTLSRMGHWVGMDFLHYQRGDGDYSFSSTRREMEDMGVLMNRLEHLPKIRSLVDRLLNEYDNLNLFPTPAVIESWLNPDNSIFLQWKCEPGHAITLDPDGSIGMCDDRMPTDWSSKRRVNQLLPIVEGFYQPYWLDSALRPWSIFDFDGLDESDLHKRWDKFLRWYSSDLDRCQGCAWTTHMMAVDVMEGHQPRSNYCHKSKVSR